MISPIGDDACTPRNTLLMALDRADSMDSVVVIAKTKLEEADVYWSKSRLNDLCYLKAALEAEIDLIFQRMKRERL